METELQKHMDAIDKRYEQWLQQTKDAFDRVDAIIEELEEPYKTESMREHIRNLRECVFDGGKNMVLDRKHFLYQTTIRNYTIEALMHRSEHEYTETPRCFIEIEKLDNDYKNGLLKEDRQ